jgi:hypothetical protein
VPKEIDVVVFPAPHDEREFLDFSGGREIIDESYHLAMRALDDYETGARGPRSPDRQRARRRWFRRAA